MQSSLGKVVVAVPGTPVVLTVNSGVTGPFYVHSYLIEALKTNTGDLYVGTQNMNKATLAGVFAIIAPPTNNVRPSFSATVAFLPMNFDLKQIWLDADNGSDGALVSVVQA